MAFPSKRYLMAQSSPATSVKVKKARWMYDRISSPKLPLSATGPDRLPPEACQVYFPLLAKLAVDDSPAPRTRTVVRLELTRKRRLFVYAVLLGGLNHRLHDLWMSG